jgi:hypothetical protein
VVVADKKKGGPKTSAGKAVASRNSIKHGLTSAKPTTSKEKELVQAYIKELTAYYEPESPLEKLQIERIAICKVKLDRLYEVEQVQLALTTEKFKRDPDQILDQITEATGTVRGMVKELITYGEITLPCQLKDQQLELICEEIGCFKNKITKESDIETYYPNLTNFLNAYNSVRLPDGSGVFKRLKLVAERIENIFRDKQEYRERFQNLVEIALRLKKQSQPDPEPPSEHALELDRLMEQQRQKREAERLKRHPPKLHQEIIAPIDPIIDQEQLTSQLKLFAELLKYRNTSRVVYQQYLSIQDLMIQGVTLPQRESDLMMRYQTALDRRLSTAMGELLHLQSRRASKAS